MSGGVLSYALLAALAIALLVAAFTDLRRRQIDNGLNAAIAIAAPLWWLAAGFGWPEVGFQVGLALGTFVIACLLFATGQMGGGDVKLLTALALWFTPASFLQLIVLMAVLGGGASVAMAAFNMQRLPGEAIRNALAGAAALVWIWLACALTFALATGRPIIGPETAAWLSNVFPTPLVLVGAILVAIALVGTGLVHIIRRQKSRLPVPYGIAISAAALWVMGEKALFATSLPGATG